MRSHDQVAALLRRTFLRHNPPHHARMTELGFVAKYLRHEAPITDTDLLGHVAGDITLAVQLVADDTAYAAACDLDQGGEAAIRRLMRAAEHAGCTPYGFVLDAGPHNGGHVWIFFKDAHPAPALRQLMGEITAAASITSAELWPSGQDLRLPFGVHRRRQRRGSLLLSSSAAPIAIDDDPTGAIHTFLDHLEYTPAAVAEGAAQRLAEQRARAEAEAQAARDRYRQQLQQLGSRRSGTELIRAYNTATDLVTLLEGYGARTARYYTNDAQLMHCAASSDHKHGDRNASLLVSPGRGGQQGKLICSCKAPNCRLHAGPGRVLDAFGVFCALEGLSFSEGVRRLAQGLPDGPGGTGGSTTPPRTPPAPPTPTTPAPAGQESAPAAVAGAWREAIAHQRAAIRADKRVSPSAYKLFQFYADRCQRGPFCRPSNAAAAAAIGVVEDTIKLRKRQLRDFGYITLDYSQCRTGFDTAIVHLVVPPGATEGGVITFPACGNQPSAEQQGGVIKRSPDKHELDHVPSLTWEGGGNEAPVVEPPDSPVANPALPASSPAATGPEPRRRREAAVAHAEGASFTPQPARRPLPKNPKARAGEIKARRLDKLRGLTLEELQRQRVVLERTAAKSTGKKRAALEAQAREIEGELARRRGAGLRSMWEAGALPVPPAAPPRAQVEQPAPIEAPQPLSPPPSQVLSGAASRRWGRDFLDDRWHALQEAQARRAEEQGDHRRAAFIRAAAGLAVPSEQEERVVLTDSVSEAQLYSSRSGLSRDVAIGDSAAVVAHHNAESVPGIVLGEALSHAPVEVLLGEQGAEGVDAFALDAEVVASLTHGILELANHARAVHPQPVPAGRDAVDHLVQPLLAGVVEPNQPFPAAFGVGAADGDLASSAVQVAFAQPGEFGMAQARAAEELEHRGECLAVAGVTGDVGDDLLGLSGAVAASGLRLAEAVVEVGRDELLGAQLVPAGGLDSVGELAEAAQSVLDEALAEPIAGHQGLDLAGVLGAPVAEQLEALVAGQGVVEAAQGGDASLAVRPERLPGVNARRRGAGLLRGVTALADVGDAVEGTAYLLDEAGALAHQGAPGWGVRVGRGLPSG